MIYLGVVLGYGVLLRCGATPTPPYAGVKKGILCQIIFGKDRVASTPSQPFPNSGEGLKKPQPSIGVIVFL
jgi:hypothetical protein